MTVVLVLVSKVQGLQISSTFSQPIGKVWIPGRRVSLSWVDVLANRKSQESANVKILVAQWQHGDTETNQRDINIFHFDLKT